MQSTGSRHAGFRSCGTQARQLCLVGSEMCIRDSSSCGEWGLLFVVVRRLLIAVASLVAEHGF